MRILALILSLTMLLSPAPVSLAEDEFTVYLPQFTTGETQEEYCAYASQLLQSSGMKITFQVYNAATSGAMQFIRDHIHEENKAFVLATEPLEMLQEEGWIEEIYPLSKTVQPVNRLALLVKNDVFSAWGQSIRTAADLENFLSYRKGETEKAPCAASPFLYDRMYGGFLWLNLFLPEEGYFSINNEFPALASAADFYTDFSGETLFALSTLPQLQDCALRYIKWMENGWVDAYMPTPRTQLAEYDALLVNTEDFQAPLMLQNNAPLAALDFSQYTLQILYAEEIPQFSAETVPASSYGICCSAETQPLLENFFAWLEQEENYRLLRYGEENTDYRVEGEEWIILPESGYSLWEQRVVFENMNLEPTVYRANLPDNFREEMQLLLQAPEALFSPEKLAEAGDMMLEREGMQAVAKLSSSAHSFWEKIYQYRTRASESAISPWIETVQAPLADAEEILEDMQKLLTP